MWSSDYEKGYIMHHGILGQKWGKRNGPPYPLSGGRYSKAEKKAIYKQRNNKNSIYNKRHFDEVLKKNTTTLSTLSYNPDRTKDTDMFYATHTKLDKHYYNAFFNKPIDKVLYDEDGNEIGTGRCLKYRIDNSLKSDIKVASEDSAAEVFRKLYSKDRDFYNFVTDEKRMQSFFVSDKYGFKGYRESRDALVKMRKDPDFVPSESDLQKVYRMFNYVLPYDGKGNKREAHDVLVQRSKFFNELKKSGYGAVLDTNDAIYGGFKARSPVIVFDMEQIIPKDVKMTTANSKRVSELVSIGRKVFHL